MLKLCNSCLQDIKAWLCIVAMEVIHKVKSDFNGHLHYGQSEKLEIFNPRDLSWNKLKGPPKIVS